ncbi:SGNH hydrolase [Aspergillus heteromorphus CBS 117.55]|uniref:SGNH hydrolase n=1 Tax=Aspergillus heteromorphus CBS 117.55 TaxID=1448321 RepID=A0A317W8R4_9EURO|nr:SGNH hydrolase [Aspergillus heteromorphus CBS 117.55]PWY82996.1 SGNH hydrolase [Aspergillus heteromorphus CBS 117.55]
MNLIISHALDLNTSNIEVDLDPTDLTWIGSWAAVGDSYTAGIGSGDLYSEKQADYDCSRYDLSYPSLLQHALGPQAKEFQYVACSGARTGDIFDQVNKLYGNLDLVVLTAGGNDLCLSDIIKTCIFLPFQGEQKCLDVINKAQENIDTILKPNVREILTALQTKMGYNGVIIYALYGQFFNTENDDCATSQDWAFPRLDPISPLALTKEHREKFNTLVVNINKAIKDVVHELSPSTDSYPFIGTADWDAFVREGLHGEFCRPESTGQYPDPSQPNLAFFKPDTTIGGKRELKKKRDISLMDGHKAEIDIGNSALYKSTLYNSPNPGAAVLHRLDPRTPSPPGCPGDDGISFGVGLPDRWGRYFHPNEIGHRAIASFILDGIYNQRSGRLGKKNPSCTRSPNEFRCWQKDGRKDYANPDLLNTNYKTYCNEVNRHYHNKNWKDERWFNSQTPEAHVFSITLQGGANTFDEAHCVESFERIINSCDGNDPENPLNWKFGGRWTRGNYIYQLDVENSVKRPWPPMKELNGYCSSSYNVVYDSYEMRGRGWASTDWGQDTLLPAIKGCVGLGVTAWDFNYLDEPDSDGNEWKVTFNTPIWTAARCFNNNKVAMKAGGFTDGCKGGG